MPTASRIRTALKRAALGRSALPQEFTLGLPDPQTEISVFLRGPAFERDVTNHLSTACAEPLTICIGFDRGAAPRDLSQLSLVFTERESRRSVLGEIGLTHQNTLTSPHSDFLFFAPRSSRNLCLSPLRTGLHYLLHAWRQWQRDNTQGIRMSFLERRASMVTFIRPHPILLVSVGDYEQGNLFPMNLCGDLGNGRFGFALRTERVAGSVVLRAGCLAVSSIPEPQGYLAYRLAGQHTKESIDWTRLPFATRPSAALAAPIPEFALRVRELEVESSTAIGSHRFFIARTIHDETRSSAPAFCSIHGFYQFRRLADHRRRDQELKRSLAVDAFHKRERHPRPVGRSGTS